MPVCKTPFFPHDPKLCQIRPDTNMANIQVLDNPAVHNLLINLSQDEAITFRQIVEQTFEDFSVGGERQYQPMPSVANRANGQNTLFRPFTSDPSIGTKITVEPAPGPDGKKDPLHGIVVLCDGKGNPTGILSSEEVTGYRTSMNAMVPFSWRKHVDHIVIFGGGMQALWHTWLILTLRGSEVKSITYANPYKEQVDKLVATVSQENQTCWKSRCSFHFIDTTALSFEREIQNLLDRVDCVFCTTPSKKPLFPTSFLTQRTSSSRQPFISAIGSWQPDMLELDHTLLHHGVSTSDGYNPVTGEAKGVVVTDDRDFALQNCGELVNSGIAAKDVVELGEVIALRKRSKNSDHTEKTNRFISEGFVVYKSIGVSMTDLTVSNAILEMFQRKQQPQQRL